MNPVDRLLGAVINPVVDAVDVNGLVNEVDLDEVLEKVDLDALLARIDIDALLARIDLDALLARVDVAALAKSAGIDEIVSDATRGVSTRILAAARRQIVGLDLIVNGIVAKFTRRPRPEPPAGPSASGLVAGPVSRLFAYFVDIAFLSVTFGVLTAIVTYLVELFSGERVGNTPNRSGWIFAVGYLVFAFFYWLIGLTIAGSSVGKALLGLRVLTIEGEALKARQALVRVLVYPFSFILGLGLIPIVTARSHRALHDKAAGTSVRYDWGDTDQASRSPLTAWLRGKPSAGAWVVPEPSPPTAAAARTRLPRRRKSTPAADTDPAPASPPEAQPTAAAPTTPPVVAATGTPATPARTSGRRPAGDARPGRTGSGAGLPGDGRPRRRGPHQRLHQRRHPGRSERLRTRHPQRHLALPGQANPVGNVAGPAPVAKW